MKNPANLSDHQLAIYLREVSQAYRVTPIDTDISACLEHAAILDEVAKRLDIRY